MVLLLILISLGFNFCAVGRRTFKSGFDFANKLAEDGLWQEAYFWWQKELARGKQSAKTHNNMAIALESMGKLKEAEEEYKKALALAPGNSLIEKNYDRLKKILYGGKNGKDEKKKK